MKLNRIVYGFAIMLLSLLFVGCGKSEKGLVGTWVDESDKVVFNKDGSFSSYYYFYPGEWQEFGEGQVRIIQSLLGAENYFYEISDDGVLILTNCYELDGEWKKGTLTYEFVREGKDLSLLDNISTPDETSETEDISKDAGNNKPEESIDNASLDASVEEEIPALSFDIDMENPIEAFGINPAANEDTKHYYSWYGCYYTGTKFSFYYPQDFFNKVEKLDSLYKEVISTNTLAYKFTGVNGSELVTAVIEYENSDSFNNYLTNIESSVFEYE